MNAVTIAALIAAGGVLLSILSSAFIAGMGWQRVNGEMRYMNDRLARIEGMFVLTPREQSNPTQTKP